MLASQCQRPADRNRTNAMPPMYQQRPGRRSLADAHLLSTLRASPENAPTCILTSVNSIRDRHADRMLSNAACGDSFRKHLRYSASIARTSHAWRTMSSNACRSELWMGPPFAWFGESWMAGALASSDPAVCPIAHLDNRVAMYCPARRWAAAL